MGFTPQEELHIRKVMGFPSEEKAVLRDLFGISGLEAPSPFNERRSRVLNIPEDIQAIFVTESIKRVVVLFKDGSKEIVDCSKEDNFDVKIGVALAICNHIFRTKTQFHKFVTKKAKYIDKKVEEPSSETKKVDNRAKLKGTVWVHKNKKNKRVPANDINIYLLAGWEKGKYHKEKQ